MNANSPIRLKGKAKAALWNAMWERDGGCCTVCGIELVRDPDLHPLNPRKPHMAHIRSIGAGGSDTLDNVALKCIGCHLIFDHNPKSVPAKV